MFVVSLPLTLKMIRNRFTDKVKTNSETFLSLSTFKLGSLKKLVAQIGLKNGKRWKEKTNEKTGTESEVGHESCIVQSGAALTQLRKQLNRR